MEHPRLLIVYASRYGQTEKIARRIGEVASSLKVDTDIMPADAAEKIALDGYDSLIVAGGVYFGRHPKALESFVIRKLPQISAMETAFVSVSGSAAAAGTKNVAEGYVHKFARRTGWVPEVYVTFGGAEEYTRYGFFTRLMMRSIARSRGVKVDVRRDYEHTDWDAVDRFARDFIGYASAKQSA